MKNRIGLFMVVATAAIFTSCDPVENRQELKGATTMDKINSKVSVTAEVRDGKKSNYLLLNAEGLDALCSFDYGVGVFVGTKARVQVVTSGENVVKFTALNADGTRLTKDFTITVEECFDVAPEWSIFCGTGEKTWGWDEQAPAVWGNGGYLGNVAPGWWAVSLADMEGQTTGEGAAAKMIFSVKGSSLTKVKSDGSTQQGIFSFDMSKKTTDDNGNPYAIGKLTTNAVTVLSGKQSNNGNAPIYSYDILKLNDQELSLCFPEPGAGAWGTAWFWLFRAK